MSGSTTSRGLPRDSGLRSLWTRRGGFFLFASLLALFLVQTLVHSPIGDLIIAVLYAAVLFTAVVTLTGRRVVVITVLFVVAIAQARFVDVRIELLVNAAFLLVAVIAILRHIVSASAVTADTVFAAASAYFLFGLLWASVYELTYLADRNAFAFPEADREALETRIGSGASSPAATESEMSRPVTRRMSSVFVYYSFVTLTTVGYGEVTPRSPTARTLATLEAFLGQLYLTILVARLVALHLVARPPPPDEEAA